LGVDDGGVANKVRPPGLGDAVSIPVVLNGTQPPNLRSWPARSALESPQSRPGVPRVITGWRMLLHAAATVGRPTSLPHLLDDTFATSELMVRLHSITSVLGNRLDSDGVPVLAPSPWAIHGADPSERRAASYRLGMTLAQWLWVHQLGHRGTRHVDVRFPSGHPVRGRHGEKSADLWGLADGVSWLMECKASITAKRIGAATRKRGWAQLLAAAQERDWQDQHGLLLISATATPLLHVVADYVPPHVLGNSPIPTPDKWPRPRSRRGDDVVDILIRRMLLETALRRRPTRRTHWGATRLWEVPRLDLAVGLDDDKWQNLLDLRGIYRHFRRWVLSAGGEDIEWGRSVQGLMRSFLGEYLNDPERTVLALTTDYQSEIKFYDAPAGRYRFGMTDEAGIVVLLGPSWATDGNLPSPE